VTRQTWEEERDARILARVLLLLESIAVTLDQVVKRLPAPPQFRPPVAIVVVVAPTSPVTAPLNLTAHLNRS
jgi:hypothetical protein